MGWAQKIIKSGFELETDGERLAIKPTDRLTDRQRQLIRQHKAEIISELQTATIYWRFIHNGIEVDFASGATLTEAYDLLRCEPDDKLVPMIEYEDEDEGIREPMT